MNGRGNWQYTQTVAGLLPYAHPHPSTHRSLKRPTNEQRRSYARLERYLYYSMGMKIRR
jgi:hypothetical protein